VLAHDGAAAINFKHLRPRLGGQRIEVAGLFLPPQAAHPNFAKLPELVRPGGTG